MNKKVFSRYILRETLGIAVMGVALFWPAGTLDWWQAWAVLLLMLAWTVATAVVILRYSPDLLAERLGPRKGARTWDTAIMSLLGLGQLARYIVAGFDQRFGWTGEFPAAVQIIALVLGGLGYAVVVWATASNAFFSQIVRIQTERHQTVVSSGPYHYVRHPAYIGALVFELAAPLVLGSWWAFIPSALTVLLLLLRTALEDHLLQAELPGYKEYIQKVRYRLVPDLW